MMALGLNCSPVSGGNCEILIKETLRGAALSGAEVHYIDVNKLTILPCQSCGESPYPDYCFFDTGMKDIYYRLIHSDLIVFASPIYFDTVSAQAKLLIDRSNCLRPAIFPEDDSDPDQPVVFMDRGFKKRKGIILLSGGQRQKFDCARTVIKGFFKWIGIEFAGEVDARSGSWKKGVVRDQKDLMDKAFNLGVDLCRAAD